MVLTNHKKVLARKAMAIMLCLGAILVGLVGWLWANPSLLLMESKPAQVDAIIVLGGDLRGRSARAAEVYHKQPSRWVVVSGSGDYADVRRELEALGVPSNAILVEGKSTSTYENAAFSIKLLREKRVFSATVVTSWYHSRRALACFRQAAPEIGFLSRPTQADFPVSVWRDREVRSRILSEHLKMVYYRAFHGVSSW